MRHVIDRVGQETSHPHLTLKDHKAPHTVEHVHRIVRRLRCRALCRPRTRPSSVVVAVPCAGLAQVIPQARRDARSSVRKRRTSERLSMLCLSTYVNDRIRLGGSLVRTLERASLLSGVDYCMRYILFACSLPARPAQGAATTVDIR